MIQTQPSITYHLFNCEGLPAEVSVSHFQGADGVDEYHLMVRPTQYACFEAQMEWLVEAYESARQSLGIDRHSCVLRRFFCSDLSNQAEDIRKSSYGEDSDDQCAVSLIRQPPLAPAKVAMWAYHVSIPGRRIDKTKNGKTLSLHREALTHIWTMDARSTISADSYGQTKEIIEKYRHDLQAAGLSLADNVIRTWFFVQNVDANYGGLVKARKDVFADSGLTPDTHFIASTGIDGTSVDLQAKVAMDAYAIAGVRPEQISYLSASENLSPTYVYGVTFERGASVSYRDRKHILISGTASIDAAGNILYEGDVLGQLSRTLVNIEALLSEAEASLHDVSMLVVYVRDYSDQQAVREAMAKRFGAAPFQVVIAPVCRPGWLVEIECQAITAVSNPSFPEF